jgi:hypothetical protein
VHGELQILEHLLGFATCRLPMSLSGEVVAVRSAAGPMAERQAEAEPFWAISPSGQPELHDTPARK